MKIKFQFDELEEMVDRLKDDKALRNAFKESSKELMNALRHMLIFNTPVKSGRLANGWDEPNAYVIRRNKDGFSVTLYNRVEYCEWVNNGHYSYNQFNVGTGRPWVVHNRSVPYTQGNSDKHFVFGTFFIERSIAQLENNPSLMDEAIMNELEAWWNGYVLG